MKSLSAARFKIKAIEQYYYYFPVVSILNYWLCSWIETMTIEILNLQKSLPVVVLSIFQYFQYDILDSIIVFFFLVSSKLEFFPDIRQVH